MPRLFFYLTLLALPVLLTQCGAAGKQFYVLTSEGPPPSGGGRGIGVGPITIASYLDRPNLVFQQGNHQLIIAESHRWAGNLDENIARVLATNLGRQLNTGNVRTYPWVGDDGLRYQVAVDINSLHGTEAGDAILEATWRIYALPGRTLTSQGSWSGTEPLRADGYDELVAAQSRLLTTLSTQIAASLR